MNQMVIGRLPLKFVEDGRRPELPVLMEIVIAKTPQQLSNNQMEIFIDQLANDDYYNLDAFFLKVFLKTVELQYWSRSTDLMENHEMVIQQWTELFSYKPPIKAQNFKNVKISRAVAQQWEDVVNYQHQEQQREMPRHYCRRIVRPSQPPPQTPPPAYSSSEAEEN
uniref:Gag protein n=1 Tax=Panagrolaimus davidi TaxID=227884 RepID=A0A914QD47_9BILA